MKKRNVLIVITVLAALALVGINIVFADDPVLARPYNISAISMEQAGDETIVTQLGKH